MTLEEFRTFKGWTYACLAKFLRQPNKPTPAPETARRYCNKERIPSVAVARFIAKKTKGLVTPNDFYGVVTGG